MTVGDQIKFTGPWVSSELINKVFTVLLLVPRNTVPKHPEKYFQVYNEFPKEETSYVLRCKKNFVVLTESELSKMTCNPVIKPSYPIQSKEIVDD
jgi:hypothetical protein